MQKLYNRVNWHNNTTPAINESNLNTMDKGIDDIDTRLTAIGNSMEEGAVSGVKGDAESEYRTGMVNLTKANLDLGNVDNTSDANKPISTATQTALDGKVGTGRKVNGHTLDADVTVTKTDVGLGNVPDVSTDNQKPTVTQASTRTNLATGDTLKTIIGKIKKFFADLGDLAFLNKDGSSSTKFLRGDGTWQNIVTGIKGGEESNYRRGDVTLTTQNIGITNRSAFFAGADWPHLSFSSELAGWFTIASFENNTTFYMFMRVKSSSAIIQNYFVHVAGTDTGFELTIDGAIVKELGVDIYNSMRIIRRNSDDLNFLQIYRTIQASNDIECAPLFETKTVTYAETPSTVSDSNTVLAQVDLVESRSIITSGDVSANSFNGKLGTATVGSSTQPVYINGGVPTAGSGALHLPQLPAGTSLKTYIQGLTTRGTYTVRILNAPDSPLGQGNDDFTYLIFCTAAGYAKIIATNDRSTMNWDVYVGYYYYYPSPYISEWKSIRGITTGTPTNINSNLTYQSNYSFVKKSGNVVNFHLDFTVGANFVASSSTKICDLPYLPEGRPLFTRNEGEEFALSYNSVSSKELKLGTAPYTQITQGTDIHIYGTYLTND